MQLLTYQAFSRDTRRRLQRPAIPPRSTVPSPKFGPGITALFPETTARVVMYIAGIIPYSMYP